MFRFPPPGYFLTPFRGPPYSCPLPPLDTRSTTPTADNGSSTHTPPLPPPLPPTPSPPPPPPPLPSQPEEAAGGEGDTGVDTQDIPLPDSPPQAITTVITSTSGTRPHRPEPFYDPWFASSSSAAAMSQYPGQNRKSSRINADERGNDVYSARSQRGNGKFLNSGTNSSSSSSSSSWKRNERSHSAFSRPSRTYSNNPDVYGTTNANESAEESDRYKRWTSSSSRSKNDSSRYRRYSRDYDKPYEPNQTSDRVNYAIYGYRDRYERHHTRSSSSGDKQRHRHYYSNEDSHYHQDDRHDRGRPRSRSRSFSEADSLSTTTSHSRHDDSDSSSVDANDRPRSRRDNRHHSYDSRTNDGDYDVKSISSTNSTHSSDMDAARDTGKKEKDNITKKLPEASSNKPTDNRHREHQNKSETKIKNSKKEMSLIRESVLKARRAIMIKLKCNAVKTEPQHPKWLKQEDDTEIQLKSLDIGQTNRTSNEQTDCPSIRKCGSDVEMAECNKNKKTDSTESHDKKYRKNSGSGTTPEIPKSSAKHKPSNRQELDRHKELQETNEVHFRKKQRRGSASTPRSSTSFAPLPDRCDDSPNKFNNSRRKSEANSQNTVTPTTPTTLHTQEPPLCKWIIPRRRKHHHKTLEHGQTRTEQYGQARTEQHCQTRTEQHCQTRTEQHNLQEDQPNSTVVVDNALEDFASTDTSTSPKLTATPILEFPHTDDALGDDVAKEVEVGFDDPPPIDGDNEQETHPSPTHNPRQDAEEPHLPSPALSENDGTEVFRLPSLPEVESAKSEEELEEGEIKDDDDGGGSSIVFKIDVGAQIEDDEGHILLEEAVECVLGDSDDVNDDEGDNDLIISFSDEENHSNGCEDMEYDCATVECGDETPSNNQDEVVCCADDEFGVVMGPEEEKFETTDDEEEKPEVDERKLDENSTDGGGPAVASPTDTMASILDDDVIECEEQPPPPLLSPGLGGGDYSPVHETELHLEESELDPTETEILNEFMKFVNDNESMERDSGSSVKDEVPEVEDKQPFPEVSEEKAQPEEDTLGAEPEIDSTTPAAEIGESLITTAVTEIPRPVSVANIKKIRRKKTKTTKKSREQKLAMSVKKIRTAEDAIAGIKFLKQIKVPTNPKKTEVARIMTRSAKRRGGELLPVVQLDCPIPLEYRRRLKNRDAIKAVDIVAEEQMDISVKTDMGSCDEGSQASQSKNIVDPVKTKKPDDHFVSSAREDSPKIDPERKQITEKNSTSIDSNKITAATGSEIEDPIAHIPTFVDQQKRSDETEKLTDNNIKPLKIFITADKAGATLKVNAQQLEPLQNTISSTPKVQSMASRLRFSRACIFPSPTKAKKNPKSIATPSTKLEKNQTTNAIKTENDPQADKTNEIKPDLKSKSKVAETNSSKKENREESQAINENQSKTMKAPEVVTGLEQLTSVASPGISAPPKQPEVEVIKCTPSIDPSKKRNSPPPSFSKQNLPEACSIRPSLPPGSSSKASPLQASSSKPPLPPPKTPATARGTLLLPMEQQPRFKRLPRHVPATIIAPEVHQQQQHHQRSTSQPRSMSILRLTQMATFGTPTRPAAKPDTVAPNKVENRSFLPACVSPQPNTRSPVTGVVTKAASMPILVNDDGDDEQLLPIIGPPPIQPEVTSIPTSDTASNISSEETSEERSPGCLVVVIDDEEDHTDPACGTINVPSIAATASNMTTDVPLSTVAVGTPTSQTHLLPSGSPSPKPKTTSCVASGRGAKSHQAPPTAATPAKTEADQPRGSPKVDAMARFIRRRLEIIQTQSNRKAGPEETPSVDGSKKFTPESKSLKVDATSHRVASAPSTSTHNPITANTLVVLQRMHPAVGSQLVDPSIACEPSQTHKPVKSKRKVGQEKTPSVDGSKKVSPTLKSLKDDADSGNFHRVTSAPSINTHSPITANNLVVLQREHPAVESQQVHPYISSESPQTPLPVKYKLKAGQEAPSIDGSKSVSPPLKPLTVDVNSEVSHRVTSPPLTICPITTNTLVVLQQAHPAVGSQQVDPHIAIESPQTHHPVKSKRKSGQETPSVDGSKRVSPPLKSIKVDADSVVSHLITSAQSTNCPITTNKLVILQRVHPAVGSLQVDPPISCESPQSHHPVKMQHSNISGSIPLPPYQRPRSQPVTIASGSQKIESPIQKPPVQQHHASGSIPIPMPSIPSPRLQMTNPDPGSQQAKMKHPIYASGSIQISSNLPSRTQTVNPGHGSHHVEKQIYPQIKMPYVNYTSGSIPNQSNATRRSQVTNSDIGSQCFCNGPDCCAIGSNLPAAVSLRDNSGSSFRQPSPKAALERASREDNRMVRVDMSSSVQQVNHVTPAAEQLLHPTIWTPVPHLLTNRATGIPDVPRQPQQSVVVKDTGKCQQSTDDSEDLEIIDVGRHDDQQYANPTPDMWQVAMPSPEDQRSNGSGSTEPVDFSTTGMKANRNFDYREYFQTETIKSGQFESREENAAGILRQLLKTSNAEAVSDAASHSTISGAAGNNRTTTAGGNEKTANQQKHHTFSPNEERNDSTEPTAFQRPIPIKPEYEKYFDMSRSIKSSDQRTSDMIGTSEWRAKAERRRASAELNHEKEFNYHYNQLQSRMAMSGLTFTPELQPEVMDRRLSSEHPLPAHQPHSTVTSATRAEDCKPMINLTKLANHRMQVLYDLVNKGQHSGGAAPLQPQLAPPPKVPVRSPVAVVTKRDWPRAEVNTTTSYPVVPQMNMTPMDYTAALRQTTCTDKSCGEQCNSPGTRHPPQAPTTVEYRPPPATTFTAADPHAGFPHHPQKSSLVDTRRLYGNTIGVVHPTVHRDIAAPGQHLPRPAVCEDDDCIQIHPSVEQRVHQPAFQPPSSRQPTFKGAEGSWASYYGTSNTTAPSKYTGFPPVAPGLGVRSICFGTSGLQSDKPAVKTDTRPVVGDLSNSKRKQSSATLHYRPRGIFRPKAVTRVPGSHSKTNGAGETRWHHQVSPTGTYPHSRENVQRYSGQDKPVEADRTNSSDRRMSNVSNTNTHSSPAMHCGTGSRERPTVSLQRSSGNDEGSSFQSTQRHPGYPPASGRQMPMHGRSGHNIQMAADSDSYMYGGCPQYSESNPCYSMNVSCNLADVMSLNVMPNPMPVVPLSLVYSPMPVWNRYINET